MDGNSHFEKIEKYLANELSIKDRIEFEAQMKLDAAFKKEVLLHKELQKALSETEVIAFEDGLNAIFQEAKGELTVTNQPTRNTDLNKWTRRKWLALVASALMLFAAGIWFFSYEGTQQSYAALVESTVKYPQEIQYSILNDQNSRGVDDEAKREKVRELWLEIKLNLDANKLEKAIELMKQVEVINLNGQLLDEPAFQYYYGLALLQNNEFELAGIAFSKINRFNEIFGLNAYWYRTIAISLMPDPERKQVAIERLELIIAEDKTHAQAAEALLKGLITE